MYLLWQVKIRTDSGQQKVSLNLDKIQIKGICHFSKNGPKAFLPRANKFHTSALITLGLLSFFKILA